MICLSQVLHGTTNVGTIYMRTTDQFTKRPCSVACYEKKDNKWLKSVQLVVSPCSYVYWSWCTSICQQWPRIMVGTLSRARPPGQRPTRYGYLGITPRFIH